MLTVITAPMVDRTLVGHGGEDRKKDTNRCCGSVGAMGPQTMQTSRHTETAYDVSNENVQDAGHRIQASEAKECKQVDETKVDAHWPLDVGMKFVPVVKKSAKQIQIASIHTHSIQKMR